MDQLALLHLLPGCGTVLYRAALHPLIATVFSLASALSQLNRRLGELVRAQPSRDNFGPNPKCHDCGYPTFIVPHATDNRPGTSHSFDARRPRRQFETSVKHGPRSRALPELRARLFSS